MINRVFAILWLVICLSSMAALALALWPVTLTLGCLFLALFLTLALEKITDWAHWTLWGKAERARRLEEVRARMEKRAAESRELSRRVYEKIMQRGEN